MRMSERCPSCEGPISLVHNMKSLTPFTLTCPSCKAKLRINAPGLWLFFVPVIVVSGLLGFGLGYALGQGEVVISILYLVGLLIFYLAFEVVEGLWIFNRGTLTVKDYQGYPKE